MTDIATAYGSCLLFLLRQSFGGNRAEEGFADLPCDLVQVELQPVQVLMQPALDDILHRAGVKRRLDLIDPFHGSTAPLQYITRLEPDQQSIDLSHTSCNRS